VVTANVRRRNPNAEEVVKRLTCMLLLLILALQTACLSRSGPPTEVAPGDSKQWQAVNEAPRVDVTTITGETYGLKAPAVGDSQVTGRWQGHGGAYRAIPLDSIAEIQLYAQNAEKTLLVMVGVVGVEMLLFILALR
jgi:hypothetical protein